MPQKSVREMSALERQHYSLGARVFHAAAMGAAILGLVSLLIGLGLYAYALAGQYIGEAFGLAKSTSLVVNQIADTQYLRDEVMSVYRGLSEEQRADPDREEYLALYGRVAEKERFTYLLSALRAFRDSSDVYDLYLGVYDRETSALVYLADPEDDPAYACPPGYWEPLGSRELEKFLSWDGTGKLYDISKTEKYGWMCTAGVPLRNDEGETVCFVLADVTMDGLLKGMGRFTLQYVIAIFIVQLLFGILLVRHMKKTVVAPINAIAEAAQEYAADDHSGGEATEHFAGLNIRTGDEIENLSLVMADMERDMGRQMTDLVRVTAEKERIGTELTMASSIQESMLPSIFPAFPGRPEIDIYASMDPAKEVGGDFYDFFLVDDDHLCMVMADVSGKGVPAALFMMASKIILANYAKMGRSPAEILMETNDAICKNNREGMFVTVWLGILELSTGKLTSANAGHEYPALMQAGGSFALVKNKHGFVIGGMEDAKYRDYTLRLEPGSKLFLYTDGVPEATDAGNALFGTDRMLAALNAEPAASPEKALENVRRAVDGFVKEAEQFDDLTMLCLEYRGPKEKE